MFLNWVILLHDILHDIFNGEALTYIQREHMIMNHEHAGSNVMKLFLNIILPFSH